MYLAKDSMSLIYSFDMSDEIAHFNRMPEHIQSSAESSAVEVIYESFVVPGDQDYLVSRLLAQKGLPRGFYWAAAQAIEKYTKAFLLINGKGVKGYGRHPIKALFDAASRIDNSLLELNILPHHSIEVKDNAVGHVKTFAISDFIDDLEKHGRADNRYNAFGVTYNTGHLFAMDSLSFQLRQRSCSIPINQSFNKLSQDLFVTFQNKNPWFHTNENKLHDPIPSKDFSIVYSQSVTKLEYMIKNKSDPACKLALQWLEAKMKLPNANR